MLHVAETRVFFERESYSVDEDAGSVSVCVRREGEASEPLSIQVTTSNLNPVDARGMCVLIIPAESLIALHINTHNTYRWQ